MDYLTISDPSDRSGLAPIREETKQDLHLIDQALGDRARRRLAEVALSLTAQVIQEAAEREDAPLSTAERDALALAGITEREPLSAEDFYASKPVVEGIRHRALVIANAVPLAEAAARLGVSDSRLRQRIGKGTLVAIPRRHGRGWLIPDFQLTDQGELPYLPRVLQGLQRRVSAETLDRVFRLPQDDLEGLSPRDWLLSGHDPLPVERLLASL